MKKTGTLLTRSLALLCAVLMMISLFALPAFAHEGHEHENEETTTTTPEAPEAPEAGDAEEKGKLSTPAIIWIIVGGVVVIAGTVLGIKYREKIVKALRVYKSEFKKVSWLSWKETKKSSLIVLGMLAACALVICLLDLGLYKGLIAMIQAIGGLFA